MSTLAFRVHTKITKEEKPEPYVEPEHRFKKKKSKKKNGIYVYGSRVLILETQCTDDKYLTPISYKAELYRKVNNKWEQLDFPVDDRTAFIDEMYQEINRGAIIVGFDLGFQISRICDGVITKKSGGLQKYFEYVFKGHISIYENPYKSTKSFWQWGRYRNKKYKGRFLDLRTFASALTTKTYTLDEVYKVYTCDNLFDLFKGLTKEFNLYGLAITSDKAYSAASIGKAHLLKAGINPFLEKNPDFPDETLGIAMASFIGGRTECRYRGVSIKSFLVDAMSMYASVFVLQDLYSWTIAKKLEAVEATEEIKDFVESVTPETFDDKKIFKKIPVLVQIVPNDDLLPYRIKSADTYPIELNHLTSKAPLWYPLSDIIACKILTRKYPRIIRAIKIIPSEPEESLTGFKLRGSIDIAKGENFIKKIVEEKQIAKTKGDEGLEQFLKTVASSITYGIFAEVNRGELESWEALEGLFGLRKMANNDPEVEKAGKYYCPLIATMITSGARLVLALMEHYIVSQGGFFAFADTDSMCIIDPVGGHPELIGGRLIEKFKSLMPYDLPDVSLIKAEKENFPEDDPNGAYQDLYVHSIASKKYCLYNIIDGEITIRKVSSHVLGVLHAPVDKWVEEAWKYIISKELGLPYDIPSWFYDAAYAEYTISKPELFNAFNKNKPDYVNSIKPHNQIRVYYTDSNIVPISSLFDDVIIDKTSGDLLNTEINKPYFDDGVLMGSSQKDGVVILKTYLDFIDEYEYHPELKFNGVDGKQCRPYTKGHLYRRHIICDEVIHIGKEANKLEDEITSFIFPGSDPIKEYGIKKPLINKKSFSNPKQKERVNNGVQKRNDAVKGGIKIIVRDIKGNNPQEFPLEWIRDYEVYHIHNTGNRIYVRPWGKERDWYLLMVKENQNLFKYGLLPRPDKLYDYCLNNGLMHKLKPDTEYSDSVSEPFSSLFKSSDLPIISNGIPGIWIKVEAISQLYLDDNGVRIKYSQIEKDFPFECEYTGIIFGYSAYKRYILHINS